MPNSWKVDVRGRAHTITVESGANQKDVVRVDGVVAAKPISVGETERIVVVDGKSYLVARANSGDYQLIELEQKPQVRAPVAEQHLSTEHASRLIPIIAWSAVAAVIAVMLMYATGPGYEKQAVKRVELVLSEMKHGTGPEAVLAVTIWAKNRRSLDSMEMNWASDNFDKWRQEKDLYRTFDSFEILGSEEMENEKVPTAIVAFSIEGNSFKVRVPKDAPITWAE